MAAVPPLAVGGRPGPPPRAHKLIPYGDPSGVAPMRVGALTPPPNTGQYIGLDQVETYVHTPRLRRFQELFFLRDPEVRPGRQYANGRPNPADGTQDGTLRNNEAWVGQMVGYPPPSGDCVNCARGNGPFTRCMVIPPRTFLTGRSVPVDRACASCIYADGSTGCSIRRDCKTL
jgi:hypothetical protein